jgi:hypothetical protein
MSEETKRCPRCSNEIQANAKQCRFCGAQFVITVRGICPNGHGFMKADPDGNCPLCNAALDGQALESQIISAPSLSNGWDEPSPSLPPPEALPAEAPPEPSALALQQASQAILPPEAWLAGEEAESVDLPASAAVEQALEQAAEQVVEQPAAAVTPPPPAALRISRGSQRRLRSAESPVYRARQHAAGLIGVLVYLALGVATFLAYPYLAGLPASQIPAALNPPPYPPTATVGEVYPAVMVVFYLVAFLFVWGSLSRLAGMLVSELVVTDQRILGRYGGLLARRVDIPLADIVTIVASHAVSPFNLGRLLVTQTNRRGHLFEGLANPQEFRRQVESQFAPGPRPSIKKISFWRVLATVLLFLALMGASALLIYLAASGEYRQFLPPANATFDTFGQFPAGRRVVIEGVLQMPDKTACDERCYVLLRDAADPARTLAVFITASTGAPGPDQMRSLPPHFEPADFQVAYHDGTLAGDGAALRLTGLVCRTTSGDPCLTEITRIEQPAP